jgi:hypothetical protein
LHNTYTLDKLWNVEMKTEKSTYQVERTRSRAHRVLFDDDLPFRGRAEKPRNNYQRRDKHRGRSLVQAMNEQ